MMRTILFSFTFFLTSFVVHGQQIDTKVSSYRITINETLLLEISTGDQQAQMGLEASDDFKVIGRPSVSKGMQVGNGATRYSISYTYTLKPLRQGTLKTPRAYLKKNGKTTFAEVVEIEITDAKRIDSKLSTQSIFIVAETSKENVYIGEEIVVTYYLYSRYRDTQLRTPLTFEANGFWTENLNNEQGTWTDRVSINGKNYYRRILDTKLLYGQKAGQFVIPETEAEIAYSEGGLFGPTRTVHLTADPIKLKVRELPPAPDGEKLGVYEDLQASLELDKMNIEVNEGVTLGFSFKGKGNLKTLGLPAISMSNDIETYEPNTADNIRMDERGMSGYRKFDQLLLPRKAGSYYIGGDRLNYFNLKTEKWETLILDTIKVVVGGSAQANFPLPNGDQKFIAIDKVIEKESLNIPWVPISTGTAGVLAAAFAIVWFRKRKPRSKIITPAALALANWKAYRSKSVVEAEGAIEAVTAFFAEMWKEDRIELTLPEIEHRLHGVLDGNEVESFASQYTKLEMSSYAGVKSKAGASPLDYFDEFFDKLANSENQKA